MAGTKERAYVSPNVKIALGRQTAQGTVRTAQLYKTLLMTAKPQVPWDLASRGVEVGSGTNLEQRSQKEVFKPQLDITGHLQVGALGMNMLAALGYGIISVGTDPASAVTTQLNGAIANRFTSTITVDDASTFNVGDYVQIGALTTPISSANPVVTEYAEVHEVTAKTSTTLTFGKGTLLYSYPDNAPVKKIRNDRKIDHYLWHLQDSDDTLGSQDLWTVYLTFRGATIIFQDCKLASFVPQFQVGQIATFQAQFKALDAHRNASNIAAITLVPDPNAITVRNSKGVFHLKGTAAGDTFEDDVNAPQQISLNLTNQIYEDSELGHDRLQSNVITGHSIGFTTQGKFIKTFFDAINFGGASAETISDNLEEVSFNYKAQSAKLIGSAGSTDPYAYEFYAGDTQIANYNPDVNTSQVVGGGIEMGKVVPAEADSSERFYHHFSNLCTTDVVSAL